MKIIKPVVITDTMITSSNIAGSSYAEWVNTTAYTAGQKVKIDAIHNEYECLIANTGEDPTQNTVDGSGNPYWLDIGSTNDWALFDGKARNPSVNANNITITIKPNKLTNSLAIINFNSGALNITATSVEGGGEVYNEDIVVREYVSGWYDYLLSDIERISNAVKIDLPAYIDIEITITATDTGDVSIGELILGKSQEIGLAQYGTSVGITDYSTKDTDTFGNFTVVERGFANRIEYDVIIERNKTAYVRKLLSQYRATPVVYIGEEESPETITYGYFKRFNIVLQDFANSEMVLEVEELI